MPRTGLLKRARIVLAIVLASLGAGALVDGAAPSAGATASPFATAAKPRPRGVRVPLLRAASPVPSNVPLGSGYGIRRGRRTNRPTFHAGADFPAPEGTPVFAARAGRVAQVVADTAAVLGFRGYGNAVVVHHPQDDSWTLYAHLAESKAREGAQVMAGAPIGTVGRTSNGRFRRMAPHLHFEVRHRRLDGRAPFPGPYRENNVDPRPWLAARGVVFAGVGGKWLVTKP